MHYKNLEKILNDYSFKKSQSKEQYYLTTNIVLNNTSNNLVIYATIIDNKIIFSDNCQLIDCFNIPDEEIEYINNEILKPLLIKDMFIESCSIKMLVDGLRFGLEISDYIKTIVLLENKLVNG